MADPVSTETPTGGALAGGGRDGTAGTGGAVTTGSVPIGARMGETGGCEGGAAEPIMALLGGVTAGGSDGLRGDEGPAEAPTSRPS
jgi:hypothetical protein